MSEAEKQAFVMGMKFAAKIVGTHWNDYATTTNQKMQAVRSSNAVYTKADALAEMSAELVTEYVSKEMAGGVRPHVPWSGL